MIRPDPAIFRAALAGVRWAAITQRQAWRAASAGHLQRALWLSRQAEGWQGYVAAIADEAIHEAATQPVTPAANGHPDVPQPVTPAVQSGTDQPQNGLA